MGISTADFVRILARLEGRRPDRASFGETTIEAGLHDEIIQECKMRLWPYVHSRMDMASTISVGAPDFFIFANEGRTICIECKNKTGKLTTNQVAWKMMLERNGHEWHLVRSFEDFLNAITTRKSKP